jgi:V/A-type H+-transporting ATPase subunit A
MEAARSLREDYLHQNAFHEIDTYASLKKQHGMLKIILEYYDSGQSALSADVEFSKLDALPVRETIGRLKYVPEEDVDARFAECSAQLLKEIRDLQGGLNDA